ncbi:glycerophosphodiester phosphodiesterase family protein [uncultured Ruminococcus sp.]|uniref:glycerophosphodiester phosphodiesterase family protein n=1 Tax=uncultured Ruminococcus sp. TaxID=165186 RepID=UPI00292FC6E3|nr:glycerophosphodiester phosphodiesterase family protein [uncultured Ruminococcus sp.]
MKKQRLLPYRQSVPSILLFQIISSLALQIWMSCFSVISRLLIRSTGHVAVTSGEFSFLFTTWQGILLIILAIVNLFLFVAVDLNALVILCNRLLTGEKPSVLYCIKEGFLSLKRFLNPPGILVVLYVSLLSPIIGFELVISLTRGLYVPKFISSVIWSNPLFSIGAVILIAALFLVGVLFIFILHGTLIDGMTLRKSGSNSINLIRKNKKKFFLEILRFFLVFLAVFAAAFVITAFIIFLSLFLQIPESVLIPITVFSLSLISCVMLMFILMTMPLLTLKLTSLYLDFKSEGEWRYEERENRKSPIVIVTAIVLVLLICLTTVSVSCFYNELFPGKVTTGFVAHRAGGFEAPENTAAGLDVAYKMGASGGEIDIQRTSDGSYIVLHDNTFSRVAGVDKKPSEMTLEEVKQLRVDGEPVPTLEDMLDASHGRLTLYVELKGETADKQMADEAVKIIKDRNMTDETVIISLKYDLIDYVESTYPEMNTGFLAFASFGDTAELNCDYLALEEETATVDTINSIHNNGKKVLVWTVNDDEDIEEFIQSGADELITDNLSGAKEIIEELDNQTPMERIVYGVLDIFDSL